MIKSLISLLLIALVRRIRMKPVTAAYLLALDNLMTEQEFMQRHTDGRVRLSHLQADRSLRLNLGCGPNIMKGWLNIDMSGVMSDVFELDLREAIPLPDNSCSMIYSEHFFEHIGYPQQAESLLSDYFRLLQPGGILSIGVPDGELGLRAYAGDDPECFFTVCKERWHPEWANTRMEQINYMFRQDGEHCFIYDEETLLELIKRAGFSEPSRRPFNPQLDSASRAWGTLYVEARRPATK